MTIGQRLLYLRRQNKWSQATLSKKTGLHSKHISRCENDTWTPSIDTLKKFAIAYGVSISYILSEDDPFPVENEIKDIELIKYFKKIETLSPEGKKFIKDILDAILLKYKLNYLNQDPDKQ